MASVVTHANWRECYEALRPMAEEKGIIWVSPSMLECGPYAGESENQFGGHRQFTRGVGDTLEHGVHRYLFRGERQWYERTLPGTMRTFHDDRLSADDKDRLMQVTWSVSELLQTGWTRNMSGAFAQACCQHYGLQTEYLDLTADLEVASCFALNCFRSPPNQEGGAIAVVDLSVAAEHREAHFVDLRHHPFAPRPRRQQAFGITVRSSSDDLKNSDVCKDVGITWHRFRTATSRDYREAYEFGGRRLAKLLDPAGDLIAAMVCCFVDAHLREYGPLTKVGAGYLLRSVPQIPLTLAFNDKYAWPEVEADAHLMSPRWRAQSRLLWKGMMKRRPIGRMPSD